MKGRFEELGVRLKRILDYFMLMGTFSLAFIYSLRRMSDSDLWGHLKCGEYFFKTGTVLKTYYFNCSWPDFPYLNHEWLFQAIVYKVNRFLGETGLVALQILLVLLSFYILFNILRLYTKHLALISFILSLGILASSHRFALRPQHFSYVFLLYFLLSLHLYQRGNRKHACLMPLVMIPWANIHAESLWGIVVPAVFIGVEYVKAYTGRGMDKKALKPITIIFGLILVASMINPFTYRTVIWPFFVMKEQFAGVEELLSPVTQQYIFFWIYFFVFVLSSVLNLRRTDPTWLLLSLIYAAVAWTANRGIPHFVFVSAPVIAINLEGIYKKYCLNLRRIQFASSGAGLFLLTLIGYTIFSVVTNPLYFNKYDNIPYPEGAIRFIKVNNIRGNAFNHHPWGGYIIWNAYPSLKPYIDGRFFHRRFYVEYRHILSVGAGWEDILSKYDISIILLPYSETDRGTINDRLFAGIHWRLVYWDDGSLLYLKDFADNKALIEKFGNTVINPDRQLYDYRETSPEVIKKANTAAERDIRVTGNSYKAFLVAGNTYFLMGDYEKALKRYEEALRFQEARNAWTYFRIALCYRSLGDLENTEVFLKKCLSLAPDFEDARQMLREVVFLREH